MRAGIMASALRPPVVLTLEDIAGPPSHDTTTPVQFPAAATTIIALGIQEPGQANAYLIQGAGDASVGVSATGAWWYPSGAHVKGQIGEVFWAYVNTPRGTVAGVGRRRASTSDSWTGPFRAVGYDTALTDEQCAAIVTILASDLGA